MFDHLKKICGIPGTSTADADLTDRDGKVIEVVACTADNLSEILAGIERGDTVLMGTDGDGTRWFKRRPK